MDCKHPADRTYGSWPISFSAAVSSTPATVALVLLTMLKVSGFILTTVPVGRGPGPSVRANTLSRTALLVGKQA